MYALRDDRIPAIVEPPPPLSDTPPSMEEPTPSAPDKRLIIIEISPSVDPDNVIGI